MNDDMALVQDYVRGNSEQAFGTLVGRYVNLVYSTALRQTRDPHLAEEITQAVFIILARKAGSLGLNTILASWLHRAAVFVAADAVKAQRRREQREQEAYMQSPSNEPKNDVWIQIAPLLDAAIAALSERDRRAIMLRYFQDKRLHEIGLVLGISEEAAKMRVNRALEKLRQFFLKRGVTSTTEGIAGAISANSIQAAPVTLAKTATAVALSKGAAASASTLTLTKGALKIMTWSKIQVAVTGAVVVGAAAYSVAQHQAAGGLRLENQSLQQQIEGMKSNEDSLSNQLADAGNAKKLSTDEFNELLRLRGEVGLLRQQTNQLGHLREQNQQLQSQAVLNAEQIAFQSHQTDIVKMTEQLTLAERIYAYNHNDQYPTNLDQMFAEGELTTTNFNGGVTTGDLEFMNSGLLNLHWPEVISFRERTARQSPDGGWVRVYGFADGSVRVISSPDDNYDAFEQQHAPSPQNQ